MYSALSVRNSKSNKMSGRIVKKREPFLLLRAYKNGNVFETTFSAGKQYTYRHKTFLGAPDSNKYIILGIHHLMAAAAAAAGAQGFFFLSFLFIFGRELWPALWQNNDRHDDEQ